MTNEPNHTSGDAPSAFQAADEEIKKADSKANGKSAKTFKERIKATRVTRWVRFGIVAMLWCLFCLWMQNGWLLLVLPLLFDIYITGYIPFTWWRKSKSKMVRSVMSWVDAIVYSLILVFFIFGFIGQNYTIPSSSLEKTLLTGDYLFVNKLIYGPRVPMTPIHFPLVHNTMPFTTEMNSYLETPSVKYHRLKGLRDVEIGDIVVFNFPAGDTVMTKAQNPDYYQLVELYGYENVNNNPMSFGRKITRPVDRRENYVKRCVGLPGQRISIKDGYVWINGKKQAVPENVQFNYFVQTTGNYLSDEYLDELGVARDDRHILRIQEADIPGLKHYDFKINEDGSVPPIYGSMPLTEKMRRQLESDKSNVFKVVREEAFSDPLKLYPFALSDSLMWTRSDYGGENGVLIPKKGLTVPLTEENWLLYERPIRVYEGNTSAEWKDGKVYINGKVAKNYTFKMDYYFMMGDNRDNSLDSRYWGFVPEDHIVGTPWRVLVSFDKDKSIFNGGIRFDRIIKDANPDKVNFQ
ncbi:MAG: signal peptidase I [Muribaculaceae bacterium]|nr:signal peptidase I [Muribaculaceae bacterium]